MIQRFNPFFALFVIGLMLFQTVTMPVHAEDKSTLLQKIKLLQSTSQEIQKGKKVITILLQASDVARLFPADPKKRAKADLKALLTDGSNNFLTILSPGGQSSLTVGTPNLRVSDMEELSLEADVKEKKHQSFLVGIPIIDNTIRINPLTMDEGYINTLTYLELLNHFHLIPNSSTPLCGEFVKVVYRFMNEKDQWAEAINPADGKKIRAISAGLHLANFHPVKYLKNVKSEEYDILAVARSRYNVLNKVEKVKKLFGKSDTEDSPKTFCSSDVKSDLVTPFRVEIQWAKKTPAEKEQAASDKELERVTLMKELLVKAYSAPGKVQGKELYQELNEIMDVPQLFRFMALNRLLENGDISDEYFWYVEKNKQTGKTRLGIMPQDGDDMFKGAHFFPTSPKQIGLIVNSSKVAKKLGFDFGYIMNYEDPLFRIIQDDGYLFYQYLEVFHQVAEEIAGSALLNRVFEKISSKIEPYANDHEVLDRGRTDARGREYSPESFAEAIKTLKSNVIDNAKKALSKLRGPDGKKGDLETAKKNAEK